ncbi:MAG: winged helix-turn-helix transcriptional regulator [OCS116 cluster bacterium]|uniref:Transcriptional regulator n=1 Tax=OCS116 cluster bacterium TaxID=2030921 RepID=A0A2A4YQU8_9PROT|nr:winged helix-turn-helix transcriptional regulator [OCS116 cluster bacterium]
MQNKSSLKILSALANENRLQIMQWIADPLPHFPPQSDGDLVDDGVCVGSIATKIGLSQPTVTKHMSILADAGLVTHKKLKNWVFYKPDQQAIEQSLADISELFK